MTPENFVTKFLPFAKESEAKTGINFRVTMAQAALESGWGEACPGNALFGVKDTDGVNGNEQLINTTEYSRRADLKFPVIKSIIPIVRGGKKWFKYKVKDYFRSYATPEESFTDHSNFLLKNPRYHKALAVKKDADKCIDEIAAAGYATDPDYAATLKRIIKMIESYL